MQAQTIRDTHTRTARPTSHHSHQHKGHGTTCDGSCPRDLEFSRLRTPLPPFAKLVSVFKLVLAHLTPSSDVPNSSKSLHSTSSSNVPSHNTSTLSYDKIGKTCQDAPVPAASIVLRLQPCTLTHNTQDNCCSGAPLTMGSAAKDGKLAPEDFPASFGVNARLQGSGSGLDHLSLKG